MKMVQPIVISDANITANNAPSDGIADYDSGTTYSEGGLVVVPAEKAIYEALTTVVGVYPPTGATNTPREWRRLRPINERAMFDGQLNTYTESGVAWPVGTGTGLQVEIDPGQVVNSVSLLQVTGVSLLVEMIDPVEGTVYSEQFSLAGSVGITSWYDWFKDPIAYRTNIILTDLPSYPNAYLRISLDGSPASCGVLLIGSIFEFGLLQYGSSVGIRDYSIKDRDEFGRPIVTERGFSNRGSFDIEIPAGMTDSVKSVLAEYRATPTLWIGTEIFDSTIIYGFYTDFDIVLANYSSSECALEIEGMTNG